MVIEKLRILIWFGIANLIPFQSSSAADVRAFERWIKHAHGADFLYVLHENPHSLSCKVVLYCFNGGKCFKYVGSFREPEDGSLEWNKLRIREIQNAGACKTAAREQIEKLLAIAKRKRTSQLIDAERLVARGPNIKMSLSLEYEDSEYEKLEGFVAAFDRADRSSLPIGPKESGKSVEGDDTESP